MLGRHFTNSCFHILRILSIVPSGSLVTEFDLWSLLQALDADTLLYIYPVCDKRRYSAFSEAISHFSPPLLQCKLLVALWFLRSIPAPWATSHFPPVWMGWTNITDLKWSKPGTGPVWRQLWGLLAVILKKGMLAAKWPHTAYLSRWWVLLGLWRLQSRKSPRV